MTASQLLLSMSNAVQQATDGYAVISSVRDDPDIDRACIELQNRVLGCDRTLVFVFDEVDYISPGSPTDSRWQVEFNIFWRNLRTIIQECARRALSVSILVSGVSSYWFTEESIGGIENAAVAFIPEEYLSPMPERATVAMLRRLGLIAGLRFDEGAATVVARATGNMPYWARKCCSYIHRQIPVNDRPCNLNAERAGSLADAFVEEEGTAVAGVALRHLFRVHPKLRSAVYQCHDGKESDVSKMLKSTLRRYGILDNRNKIEGAMMRNTLVALRTEELSEEATVPTANERGLGGSSLEEWAEEIATLNRRRNLLERRLRAILVNFVRFSCLGEASVGVTVRQRLIRGVHGDRRRRIQHLSADDIVSKFTWKELTDMIGGREWALFERIFGDSREFGNMCDLVNDRFDAHAKDADLADIALYRRALSYVEEKIDRIG